MLNQNFISKRIESNKKNKKIIIIITAYTAVQHFHRVALHLLESELLVYLILEQATSSREIPLLVLFLRSAVGSLKSPVLG